MNCRNGGAPAWCGLIDDMGNPMVEFSVVRGMRKPNNGVRRKFWEVERPQPSLPKMPPQPERKPTRNRRIYY